LRWLLPGNLQFTVGGGPGLTNGYGTPRYRVFAGIGFDPNRAVKTIQPKAPILVQESPAPPPVAPAPAPHPIDVLPPMPEPHAIDALPPLPEPHAVLALVAPADLQRTVRDGHLALLAQVQFKHDDAAILPVSAPLLDKVVGLLRDSPDIHKVRIDGHT